MSEPGLCCLAFGDIAADAAEATRVTCLVVHEGDGGFDVAAGTILADAGPDEACGGAAGAEDAVEFAADFIDRGRIGELAVAHA